MKTICAAVALLFVPSAGMAKDLETTHLFGFTLGSDVNDVGEIEGETETTGRFRKSAGSYTALSAELGLKFIPFQNFSIEPGAGIAYHSISNVPQLDDRQQLEFDTVSLEMRYRLFNRERAPFGLTLGADPHWGRVDDISGESVERYGTNFWIIADKELVANRIFAAFNLSYQPEAVHSRVTGIWEHQSQLDMSAAGVLQVWRGVLIGAEVQYMRSYDGLGLDALKGHALFIGPTFYARISERCWISAAWSAQVRGHALNDVGSLDLMNFERHHATLRLGYNF